MQWERPGNQTPPVSNSHSSYEDLERSVSEGRGGYIARGRKYDNVPPLCSHIEGDSCSLYLSRQQEHDEGSERKLFACSYAFGASEWVEGEGSICQEPLSRLLLSCRSTLWGRSIHTLGQPNYAMVDPSRACDAVSCDVRCEARKKGVVEWGHCGVPVFLAAPPWVSADISILDWEASSPLLRIKHSDHAWSTGWMFYIHPTKSSSIQSLYLYFCLQIDRYRFRLVCILPISVWLPSILFLLIREQLEDVWRSNNCILAFD